jgi:hypothetical protein
MDAAVRGLSGISHTTVICVEAFDWPRYGVTPNAGVSSRKERRYVTPGSHGDCWPLGRHTARYSPSSRLYAAIFNVGAYHDDGRGSTRYSVTDNLAPLERMQWRRCPA